MNKKTFSAVLVAIVATIFSFPLISASSQRRIKVKPFVWSQEESGHIARTHEAMRFLAAYDTKVAALPPGNRRCVELQCGKNTRFFQIGKGFTRADIEDVIKSHLLILNETLPLQIDWDHLGYSINAPSTGSARFPQTITPRYLNAIPLDCSIQIVVTLLPPDEFTNFDGTYPD